MGCEGSKTRRIVISKDKASCRLLWKTIHTNRKTCTTVDLSSTRICLPSQSPAHNALHFGLHGGRSSTQNEGQHRDGCYPLMPWSFYPFVCSCSWQGSWNAAVSAVEFRLQNTSGQNEEEQNAKSSQKQRWSMWWEFKSFHIATWKFSVASAWNQQSYWISSSSKKVPSGHKPLGLLVSWGNRQHL